MTTTGSSTAPLNILIIDDKTDIRKTLSHCLAAEGHSVVAVSNSAHAVEETRRWSFDMAFVDHRLGEEDKMDLVPALLAGSPWMKFDRVQTALPNEFIGNNLRELNLRAKYNVHVIAIRELVPENFILVPPASFVIK